MKQVLNQGNWTTITKKNLPKVYVVFRGFQPGIYTSWHQCHSQVNKFPGAAYKAYPSMEEAKQAFHEFYQLQNAPKQGDVKDFYDPGLPRDIYEELNGVWRNSILNQKAKFRQHMANLARKIKEQTDELQKIKGLCSDLVIQQDWYEELNEQTAQKILMVTDLIQISDLSPEHNRIRRICLFEKAKHFLPREVFQKIRSVVEDHTDRITQILKDGVNFVNYSSGIPKITCFLNDKEFCDEEIDLGITNQVVFHGHAANQWISFPAMIKSMLFHCLPNMKWHKYYTFWIDSSIGWRIREKFFQPYQIWFLKETKEIELEELYEPLHMISEDLTKIPDFEKYAAQSLINLSAKAAYIRRLSEPLTMVTDGRRLFVTSIQTDYASTQEQISQTQQFLSELIKMINLDVPEDIWLVAEELQKLEQYSDSQYFDSPPDYTDEELHNIENLLEG